MNEIKTYQDDVMENNNKLKNIDEKIKMDQKELENVTNDLSDNFSRAETS